MFDQTRPQLPLKKRYVSQMYHQQTSLKVEPADPLVQTQAMDDQPLALIKPLRVHRQQPRVFRPRPPTAAVPQPPTTPQAHQQPSTTTHVLQPSQSVNTQQPEQQQVAAKRRNHSQPRQPRQCKSICYHSFNFKYPQEAPLDLSKGHKCRHCTKSHSRLNDRLKAHQRRNDIKKSGRYTCEECGKPFVQQSSLITHRRIHTGEKPYHCQICNNSYGDLSTFTKHTRTHTGEKPYKCEFCDQRFSQSGNCLRHKRSVHADIFTWL